MSPSDLIRAVCVSACLTAIQQEVIQYFVLVIEMQYRHIPIKGGRELFW